MNRRTFFGVVGAATLMPVVVAASQEVSFPTIRHQLFDILHTTAKEQFAVYGKGKMDLSFEAQLRVYKALCHKIGNLEHLIGTSVKPDGTMKIWRYQGEFCHTVSIFPEGGSEYAMRRWKE